MTIIREQDAPRFGQDGVEVTGLASPSRGSDTVSAWRVLLQPGAASPEHTLTSDEAFVAAVSAAGVDPAYAGFLAAIFHPVRENWTAAVTDGVERLTGAKPRSLATYARDHAAALKA